MFLVTRPFGDGVQTRADSRHADSAPPGPLFWNKGEKKCFEFDDPLPIPALPHAIRNTLQDNLPWYLCKPRRPQNAFPHATAGSFYHPSRKHPCLTHRNTSLASILNIREMWAPRKILAANSSCAKSFLLGGPGDLVSWMDHGCCGPPAWLVGRAPLTLMHTPARVCQINRNSFCWHMGRMLTWETRSFFSVPCC